MELLNQLQTIIRSFSPPQKRYLRQFLSTKKNQRELIYLYEVLNKKEIVSKESVRFFAHKGGFTFSKGIQKELYDHLVNSLYHYLARGKNKSLDLERRLSHIQVLKKHGIIKILKKEIREAKKIAKKKEDFNILLELYHLEIEVIEKEIASNGTAETKKISIQNIQEKISKTSEILLDIYRIKNLHVEITKWARLLSKGEEKVKELMNSSPFLDKDYVPSCCLVASTILDIHMNVYIFSDKFFEALACLESLLDFKKKHIEIYRNKILKTYHNLIYVSSMLLQEKKQSYYYNDLIALKVEESKESQKKMILLTGKMWYYCIFREHDNPVKFLNEKIHEAKQLKLGFAAKGIVGKILITYSLKYNILKKGIKIYNIFFSQKEDKYPPPIMESVSLRMALIHFSLRHYVLAESMFRKLKRDFKKSDNKNSLILFFLQRMISISLALKKDGQLKRIRKIRKLIQDLGVYDVEGDRRFGTPLFNINSWLNSEYSGVSMIKWEVETLSKNRIAT